MKLIGRCTKVDSSSSYVWPAVRKSVKEVMVTSPSCPQYGIRIVSCYLCSVVVRCIFVDSLNICGSTSWPCSFL